MWWRCCSRMESSWSGCCPASSPRRAPGNARLAQLAARVLRPLKSLPTAPLHSKALAGVSRQEHRVLSYVAEGYTNKQIGRALTLSESTVKFHLRSLFKKLNVTTRGAPRRRCASPRHRYLTAFGQNLSFLPR